jgi:hypothetical protein
VSIGATKGITYLSRTEPSTPIAEIVNSSVLSPAQGAQLTGPPTARTVPLILPWFNGAPVAVNWHVKLPFFEVGRRLVPIPNIRSNETDYLDLVRSATSDRSSTA